MLTPEDLIPLQAKLDLIKLKLDYLMAIDEKLDRLITLLSKLPPCPSS